MVIVLIALTAFFVASEFAVVKVRKSKIDQLIEEGNSKAKLAKKITENLDEYLSACQLGITITALGLGWLGEPTVEHLLSPVFEKIGLPESIVHISSFILAFIIITFLHVVVGELAPKSLAIQKAEAITLMTARPLALFYKVMYPFIWTLNGSARLVAKIFGLKEASEHEIAHSEEELRLILTESYESGEINQSEYHYVNNIFEFDNRVAKEIMVPRTEMVTIDKNQSIDDIAHMMHVEKYTRYPVMDEDKDHIIGILNIKEIFADLVSGNISSNANIEEYVRPTIKVIDSIPIHELLIKMQKERIHMAILVDEYGGTSGLVTVEDILEEIVGEIRDEFDVDEIPEIHKINKNKTVIQGKVLISEVNELFHLEIDDSEVDTIGGWLLTEKVDIEEGDTIDIDRYTFKVKKMEGRQVKLVEVVKNEESKEAPSNGEE